MDLKGLRFWTVAVPPRATYDGLGASFSMDNRRPCSTGNHARQLSAP